MVCASPISPPWVRSFMAHITSFSRPGPLAQGNCFVQEIVFFLILGGKERQPGAHDGRHGAMKESTLWCNWCSRAFCGIRQKAVIADTESWLSFPLLSHPVFLLLVMRACLLTITFMRTSPSQWRPLPKTFRYFSNVMEIFYDVWNFTHMTKLESLGVLHTVNNV